MATFGHDQLIGYRLRLVIAHHTFQSDESVVYPYLQSSLQLADVRCETDTGNGEFKLPPVPSL